jgi:hypothetical protein
MSTRFTGKIVGSLENDVAEPLDGAQVRVYRIQGDAPAATTSQPLAAETVQDKAHRLVAEAATDAQGGFALDVAPGEGLEVDVALAGDGDREARQFTVARVDPAAVAKGGWEHRIATPEWIDIRRVGRRRRVIYGQITVCGTRQGVEGLKVSAFDSDCIQDDALGSDVTDGSGNYAIYYTEAQYKRTPLSPLINIDTPLSGNDGPDVYMRVQTSGGDVLLDEASSVGRGTARSDVPYSFRLDLCVKGEVHKPPTVATLPMFERVGVYSVLPADGHFTAAGLTTVGQFAFTEAVPLVGVLPDGGEGDALEYRFTAREYANADGTGALGASIALDGGFVGATEIGTLVYLDFDHATSSWLPQKSTPFYAGHPGNPQVTVHRPLGMGGDVAVPVNTPVKAGGWIEVPRLDELSFGGRGKFKGGTLLAELNTAALSHLEVNLGALAAGQPVPVGQRARPHVFELSFEARKTAAPHPTVSSSALQRISVINTTYTYVRHPNWAGGPVSSRGVVSMNVAEVLLGMGTACGKVDTEVHVTYTVYHPFIRSASVSFEGPVPVAGATVPVAGGLLTSPDVPAPGIDGQSFDLSAAPSCAYTAWLGATVELTRGNGQIWDGGISDHISFCKG